MAIEHCLERFKMQQYFSSNLYLPPLKMSFFNRLKPKKETSLEDAIAANKSRSYDRQPQYEQEPQAAPSGRLPSSPRPQRGQAEPPSRFGNAPQYSNGGSDSRYGRDEKSSRGYEDEYDSRSTTSTQPPGYARGGSQGRSNQGSYDDEYEKPRTPQGRFGEAPGRRREEPDKSELFSGYRPADPKAAPPPSRFFDGPTGQFGQPGGRQRQARPPSPSEGGDEEEGAKWYQQATVDTLKDSSSSLQRSKQLLGETLETADATLQKLDHQTGTQCIQRTNSILNNSLQRNSTLSKALLDEHT